VQTFAIGITIPKILESSVSMVRTWIFWAYPTRIWKVPFLGSFLSCVICNQSNSTKTVYAVRSHRKSQPWRNSTVSMRTRINSPGSLPKKLPPSLEWLGLANNGFTGSIPSSMASNVPYLGVVDLNGNPLSGSVPSSFGKLPSLYDFRFGKTNLKGSVDSFLCNKGTDWAPLEADCNEVTCSCCTWCCTDGQAECLDFSVDDDDQGYYRV